MAKNVKGLEVSYDKAQYITARIYVTQCERKDGTKFPAYKILETATHRKVDLRFPRTVTAPTDDCFIVVPKSKINKDNNRDYPCYWVREITDTLPIAVSTADVSKYFDEGQD